jgi:hypothetical protein
MRKALQTFRALCFGLVPVFAWSCALISGLNSLDEVACEDTCDAASNDVVDETKGLSMLDSRPPDDSSGDEGVGDARSDAMAEDAQSDVQVVPEGGTNPPPVGVALELVSDYSGTCVDVGSTKLSGTALSLTVCQDLAEQLLVLRAVGTASYSMFNPNSGKCVAVDEPDGQVLNGAGLELQECSDASAQLFRLQGTTGAYFFIARVGNFVCLDDAAFGANNGAPIVVYGCNSGINQQWSLRQ